MVCAVFGRMRKKRSFHLEDAEEEEEEEEEEEFSDGSSCILVVCRRAGLQPARCATCAVCASPCVDGSSARLGTFY